MSPDYKVVLTTIIVQAFKHIHSINQRKNQKPVELQAKERAMFDCLIQDLYKVDFSQNSNEDLEEIEKLK